MGVKRHRMLAAPYDRENRPFEREILAPRRLYLLAGVTGDVLDVGAGTGVNLPYLRQASRVVAAEPDPAMRQRLIASAARIDVRVEVEAARAEMLPHSNGTFDAVLFTLVLCSVDDPDRALAEARRVLKPTGRIFLLEHIRGDGRLARWQDLITPLWIRCGAGCHPGRDTRAAVERAGFTFVEVEAFQPMRRWMPVSPWMLGVAKPTT